MLYQTFPWVQGKSLSPNKLAVLELPRLEGKSVLDAGCSTGFFCGFAKFQGAARVTGVDIDEESLRLAREWFPSCQFLQMDWDSLGDEKYDVILFLDGLQYAAEPQAMLDRLMGKLNPGGLLVLETGVVPCGDDVFEEIAQAEGSVRYPSWKKLEAICSQYVYKYIAPGVTPDGEAAGRHIYHVRRRLPAAVLFMDAPHSGKTNSSALFREDIKRISGDCLFYEIMHGKREAPEAIKEIVREWTSGEALNCAAVIFKVCRNGLMDDLCEMIRKMTGGKNFILDMYVPARWRREMCDWWEVHGFFVVDVSLHKARTHPHEAETLNGEESCRSYLGYLSKDFLINEADYLAANPGVAQTVAAGLMPSAQYHYWNYGRREGRPLKPAEKEE